MSQQIGKNFSNQVVIGAAIGGPATVNYFGMLFGKVFRGIFFVIWFFFRAISMGVFALLSSYYVRRIARFVDVVATKLDRLSEEAKGHAFDDNLEAKTRAFRVSGQGTVKEMVKIAWLGVRNPTGGSVKDALVGLRVAGLHEALDDLEHRADQGGAQRLAVATRAARNEMISLAYSMLGADIARDGDRNARKRAIIRNTLIATCVLGAAIWWWTTYQ